MPTYRYRCSKCGEEMETWQSITDPPLTRHVGDCGGELRTVYSPAGIVLKGSGFYKNDSRSGSGRSGRSDQDRGDKDGSKDTSSGSDGDTSSKSDGKSDTKSDTKSDKSDAASKSGSKSDSKTSTASPSSGSSGKT